MKNRNARKRLAHELTEFLVLFLCLAPFFVSFATYRMYLLGDSGSAYFEYGAALVSALVMSKIVLIGELVGLGRKFEKKPLIVSTVYKAMMFTLLYLPFDVLEGTLRGVVRGQTFSGALYQLLRTARQEGEFLSAAVVIFFAFLPFFALRETRRVIGEDKFHDLFVGAGPEPQSAGDSARTVTETI